MGGWEGERRGHTKREVPRAAIQCRRCMKSKHNITNISMYIVISDYRNRYWCCARERRGVTRHTALASMVGCTASNCLRRGEERRGEERRGEERRGEERRGDEMRKGKDIKRKLT